MIDSSSLSKARLLNILTLTACFIILASTAAGLITEPWWAAGIMIAIAVCLLLSGHALGKLERELKRMTRTINALAAGDFEVRLTGITEKGTLGDFQWRLNEMVDAVDAFIREATAAMDHVSRNLYFRRIIESGMQGNFLNGARVINRAAQNVEDKMNGFTTVAHDLEISLNQVVRQINGTSTALTQNTDTMQSSVAVTRQDVDAAMQNSNNTSMSVQTISAAAEEMSSCIAEITQQMEKTSRVAKSAVGESARAREIIVDLTQMADKISDVVGIIQKIAEQTNLLALNATIEAARAGETGKGFAVVASEVKQLAGQTGAATEEIALIVANIQSATTRAVSAFQAIDSVITEVNEASSIVASAIEEQSAASKEIALNASLAATDTDSVAENVRDINTNIVLVGQAAQDTLHVTNNLSKDVTHNVHSLLAKMGLFMAELKKIS